MDGKGRTGEQDRLAGKAGNVGNGGRLDGKGEADEQDKMGGTTEIVGGALEVIESRNKVTFFFNLVIWSKFI